MSETKFETGKEYLTRDGRRARVYATDGSRHAEIHGAVLNSDGEWHSITWQAGGVYVNSYHQHCGDLMPPKPKGIWLNIMPSGRAAAFETRKEANEWATDSRIACVYVEEGQGLEGEK